VKKYIKGIFKILVFVQIINGQILIDDFSEDTLSGWWSSNTDFQLSLENNSLEVSAFNVGPGWQVFGMDLNDIDFSESKIIKCDIKSNSSDPIDVRIDLQDINGNTTNESPSYISPVLDGNYYTYYFDFTDRFTQSWPSNLVVDSENISKIVFFINPGGESFTGSIFIDNIYQLDKESLEVPEYLDNFDSYRNLQYWFAINAPIDNPNRNGINTSSKVGLFERQEGSNQVFGGGFNENFNINEKNNFNFKIYCNQILSLTFVLQVNDGLGNTEDIAQVISEYDEINEWKNINFDFTNYENLGSVNSFVILANTLSLQSANIYFDDFYLYKSLELIIGSENVTFNSSFSLLLNYPNPFNPATEIPFQINMPGFYELIIYDLKGNKIEILLNQRLIQGNYSINWEPKSIPTGTYIYQLKSKISNQSNKLIFIK